MSSSPRPERIRLNGIDCPEKGQAYGKRAKQAASGLVFGKEVTLLTHGLDKYGRTLANPLLTDGVNLNQELVNQGWCWWWKTTPRLMVYRFVPFRMGFHTAWALR